MIVETLASVDNIEDLTAGLDGAADISPIKALLNVGGLSALQSGADML